jgi:hypothetical protein
MLIGLASTPSIQQMIITAANQYGVPPSIALGIAAHESGFNPNATNVNPATSTSPSTTDYGVMQLNTSVLQTYGLTPAQAYDPQTNIDTAMQLLGGYISKYGNIDTALQAYASGPGTVASGAAPNATAASFISCVTAYPNCPGVAQPDPSILASLSDSSDSSAGTVTTASMPGSDIFTTAFTDLGAAFSSGDFSGMSGSDWLVIGGGVALVVFLGFKVARG